MYKNTSIHTYVCTYEPKTTDFQIYDGANSSSPLIGDVCGTVNPSPVFSSTNNLFMEISLGENMKASLDLTYTSSNKPQGCGGVFFNTRGTFTSPLYPNNYRNDSECDYNIQVPSGLQISLKFNTFDILGDCDTNYLTVITYNDNIPNQHKFCSNVSIQYQYDVKFS